MDEQNRRLQRLQSLTTSIDEAFWLTDWKSRRVLYISPGYEVIWGRSCASLYAKPRSWVESIHPEDRPAVERRFECGAATGDYDVIYRIVRPDGELRWVHDRAFPVPGEEGETIQVAGISEDITHRVEAERRLIEARDELAGLLERRDEELRSSRLRYRALVETSPDAVVILDPRGRLSLVNKRAREIYGGVDDGVIDGRVFTEFIVPEQRGEARRRFRELLKRGGTNQSRYRMVRGDGQVFPAEISSAPLRGSDGVDGVIVILRDVGRRLATENELRFQRDLLSLSAEISSLLINHPAEKLEDILPEVLGRLGRFTECDRVTLFRFTEDSERLRAEWIWTGLDRRARLDDPRRRERLAGVVESLWMDREASAPLVIEDAAEEADALDLAEAGTRALLGVPLYSEAEPGGLLTLETLDEPREWKFTLQLQLRVMAENLAGALERMESQRRRRRDISRLRFLSQTALELVSLPPTADLYAFIAEKLRGILGQAYVLVNTYDARTRSFELRAIAGSRGPLNKLVEKLGRRFIGESFPINDAALAGLMPGTLQPVENGVYDLASGALSRTTARLIERMLKVEHVYSIGVVVQDELVGSISLLLQGGTGLENRETLEGFLGQAAVALQRRRAEDELRRGRQEYQEIIENNPDLIARVDKQMRYLYVNEAVAGMFGMSAAAMIGRRHGDIDPDSTRLEDVGEALETVFGQRRQLELEKEVRHEETVFFFHLRLVPEFTDEGGVESVLIIARDISRLKDVESRLRESEQRYRLTLNSLDDAIHLCDRELRISLANQALRDWTAELGLEKELLDRSVSEAFPFLDERVIEEYRRVFDEGRALDSEDRLELEGRTYIVRTRKIPIFAQDDPRRVERVVTVLRDVTARWIAEKALRESEQLQRALFDGSTDPVLLADLDGRVVAANPANERVFGFPPAELVGRNLLTLTGLDQELFGQWVEVCRGGLGVSGHESTRLHRSGGRLPVSVSISPVNDAEGRLRFLSFWYRDIGPLRRTLDRLAESERKHRLLLESIPSPVLALEPDFRIRYCNPAFAELVGENLADLEGRLLTELFTRLLDTAAFQALRAALRSDEPREVEQAMEIKGRRLHLAARIHPAPWGLLILATDITERKRQELKLRHLNRVMQGLHSAGQRSASLSDTANLLAVYAESLVEEHSYGGIWFIIPAEKDEDGCELIINDGGGVERHSLAGPPPCLEGLGDVCSVVTDDPEACGDCDICSVFDRGDDDEALLVWDLRHGERLYGWIGALVEDELGVDDQQRALFSEVAADAASKLHRIELLRQRSWAEAEREQLHQQLVSKNRELEQIVYITSHDLRSPLLNIQGFSGELKLLFEELGVLLKSASLPADLRDELEPKLEGDIPEALGFINSSVYRMDGLLSGLLRLSRLGRRALRLERLDVGALVEEIRHNFMFRIEERGVEFLIGELPPCRADRDQLSQLFSNLVDNALKYLQPGVEGRIEIGGRNVEDGVEYWVADNGIGIPRREQQRVFEVFQRIEREKPAHWAAPDSGDGLGLTIVRRILERHGGGIRLESATGEGSRFIFTLPGGETQRGERIPESNPEKNDE